MSFTNSNPMEMNFWNIALNNCEVSQFGATNTLTSLPIASPLSQSSTYSMDSGYLEQTGTSPSQMSATSMTHQQQFLSPNHTTSGSMQNYADYSDHGSPSCMQAFYETPIMLNQSYMSSPAPAIVPTNIYTGPGIHNNIPQPYLEVVEQPADKPFRFRYKSEMHGTHGSLMGIKTERSRRTYPTVALRNFGFITKAIIRCSLYQVPNEAVSNRRCPHSHKLVIRRGDIEESDPHVIEVSNENDFTATFQGMGIIHTAKRNIKDELAKKIRTENQFEIGRELTQAEMTSIDRDAEKQSKEMNLNQVCLCFQAFIKNDADNKWVKLCEPIFSNVINNMKSALTGELRITRMSTYSSPVEGKQEVFMFVEKVCKNNIKVKFFEMKDDKIVWEDFGEFNESDVHHQYGIVLKTPSYTGRTSEASIVVQVQLYRPSDGCTSEPIDFRYKSLTKAGTKRSRNDSKDYIPTVVGSHELSTQSPSPSVGPRQSHSNFQSFGSKSNSSQNYDTEVSFFDYEPLPSYIASFTPSDVSFCSNDFKGLFNHEDLCRWLDREIPIHDSKLEKDSAGNNRVTTMHRTSSELGCSLLEKMKMIIKLFKNNFDKEKLREMMMTLIEVQSETGENILLDCIENGEIDDIKDLVLILVKYKMMDVLKSVNDLDQNCLHLLILAGYKSLLKAFLELGADSNQADAFGQTPLHVAVIQNCQDSVNDLLQAKTQIKLDELNDDGFSALHIATRNDNFEIVKHLIEAGASIQIRSPPSGDNVLHMAVTAEVVNLDLMNYLIACDEQLLMQENNSRMNVLQLACDIKKSESLIQHLSTFYEESYNTSDPHFDTDDDEEGHSDSDNETDQELFDEECLKKLSEIFDQGQKWKKLLMLMDLEAKSEQFGSTPSPSESLFKYLEQNQKPLDYVLNFFILIEDTRAITEIDAMLARKFDK